MSRPIGHMLSRPDAVNVAHMVQHCRVLGPGDRFVLWVQGCPLCCEGCHNPQFQPFEDRLWLGVNELAAMILAVKGIEGASFAGGEPFGQVQALARLAGRLRAAGLSVMVYSGFTLERLRSGEIPHAQDLLDQTDLLLDGPYCRDLPTNRPWRGSNNQRLISLSGRYGERVSEWNAPTGQEFELRVSENGEVEILGIPPLELMQVWKDRCLAEADIAR